MAKKIALKLTTKTHTGFGLISFLLGVLSIACFSWAVVLSSINDRADRGSAMTIGVIEIIAILMSLVGIPFGIMGELTKETYKVYAHIGMLLNVVIIIFHIIVLIYGF